jgi:hypothetical protein
MTFGEIVRLVDRAVWPSSRSPAEPLAPTSSLGTVTGIDTLPKNVLFYLYRPVGRVV